MSGVKVQPECVNIFNEIKMKKAYRFILFGLVNGNTEIGVLETAQRDCTFEDLQERLRDFTRTNKKGCYALYDYENEEKKTILVFINWCPDSITMREKMLLAASKDALKKILIGVRPELQVNEEEDLTFKALEEKALRL